MSPPLRIGLIGAGMIGRKHAQYLRASPDCALVAIADPSPQATAFAAEQGAAWHGGFEALFDREQIDGVIIAAPNDQHEAAGIEAAARGLPMLVEKPIASDLDAAARLAAAADRARVPLLVGHHRRYNPRARHARSLIREGALGHLVGVNALWAVRKPEAYYDATWKTKAGGGPVLINLIHEVDMLRFLCGEITEVMAMRSNAVRGFEVEDSAVVTFRFETGALGTVLISDTAPSPWSWEQATGENHPTFPANEENPTRLFGTEAAMEFPRLKLWRHAGPRDWHHPLAAEQPSLPEIDVFSEQITHFARVIRRQEQPIITGEDASRSLAATLAVIEAASSNEVIGLD